MGLQYRSPSVPGFRGCFGYIPFVFPANSGVLTKINTWIMDYDQAGLYIGGGDFSIPAGQMIRAGFSTGWQQAAGNRRIEIAHSGFSTVWGYSAIQIAAIADNPFPYFMTLSKLLSVPIVSTVSFWIWQNSGAALGVRGNEVTGYQTYCWIEILPL